MHILLETRLMTFWRNVDAAVGFKRIGNLPPDKDFDVTIRGTLREVGTDGEEQYHQFQTVRTKPQRTRLPLIKETNICMRHIQDKIHHH